MKGFLIVIEGIDGSGKTTQVNLLSEYLKNKNIPYEVINFPRYGNNEYTDQIERYLKGEEKFDIQTIAKVYAADRSLAKPQIENWLNEDKIVIANRYTAANIAHLGTDLKEDMPKPDLTMLLDVDPKVGQKNSLDPNRPDIHEEDLNHLEKARKYYLDLANSEENWKVIECMEGGEMKSKEQIHKLIVEISDKYLVS